MPTGSGLDSIFGFVAGLQFYFLMKLSWPRIIVA